MAEPPYLRIVKGDPSKEEIAALVATLTALAAQASRAADPGEQPAVRTNWNDRARLLRAQRYRMVGGWRRSALP